MSRTVETWARASAARYPTPAACMYISGDAFLALALKAYLAAGRNLVPPSGERWIEDESSWGSAQDFFDDLTFQIAERLRAAALETGDLYERPWTPEEEEEDRLWQEELSGAGQSPAVTAPVSADRLYVVARRA